MGWFRFPPSIALGAKGAEKRSTQRTLGGRGPQRTDRATGDRASRGLDRGEPTIAGAHDISPRLRIGALLDLCAGRRPASPVAPLLPCALCVNALLREPRSLRAPVSSGKHRRGSPELYQLSSGGAPPTFATSSCFTRSTLKRVAAAIILSITSSKSNSVDFEKRIGFTRAMTNGRR